MGKRQALCCFSQEGLDKDKHRTSNVQHRTLNERQNKGKNLVKIASGDPEMVKTYSACATHKKPASLNDNLQETGELLRFSLRVSKRLKRKKWPFKFLTLDF